MVFLIERVGTVCQSQLAAVRDELTMHGTQSEQSSRRAKGNAMLRDLAPQERFKACVAFQELRHRAGGAAKATRGAGIDFVGYHLAKKYTPFARWRHRIAWRFSPVEFAFPDYIFEFARRSES